MCVLSLCCVLCAVLFYAMQSYVILSFVLLLCYIMFNISCHVMLCHVTLSHVICCLMICRVVSCRVAVSICDVVLCQSMFYGGYSSITRSVSNEPHKNHNNLVCNSFIFLLEYRKLTHVPMELLVTQQICTVTRLCCLLAVFSVMYHITVNTFP